LEDPQAKLDDRNIAGGGSGGMLPRFWTGLHHLGHGAPRSGWAMPRGVFLRGDTMATMDLTGESALKQLTEDLVSVAVEAGMAILPHAGAVDVKEKDDASPVTLADEAAETIILEGLKRLAPDVPVVAEESVAAGKVPEVGEIFFLVDPLDGTKEFIKGGDDYTVNIGLIRDGEPVAGVVFAPARGRLWVGYGNIAYEQSADATNGSVDAGSLQSIGTRPLPEKDWVAVASKSHRTAETDEVLSKLPVKDTVSAGSSLKFCLVATAEADVYPRMGRTMEWDTAAGHAVLKAAGGTVTKPDGTPFRYGKAGDGFANGHFIAWGRP
jgi:3'(2'),5'-bisphosphate nucleotidase